MLKQANLSFSVAAQSFGDDVTSIQFSTQDRNTAKLIFTIKEWKQPLNLTDVEGIVDLVMGDKSIFEDNKATVTAPLDGKLEYTITADQIRHPGRARGELQLVKKDGQSLGGFRFNFTIKRALVDEYAGPVKEYYVQDLEAIKAEIRKTADSIKDLDVVRIDSKLNELEQKVEEGGVGVDEQARQDIQNVTTLLAGTERYSVSQGWIRQPKTGLIAHRGSHISAPENTLKSIQLAGELGYEAIEIDVNMTSNGVFVLMHDDTVDRTTNGTGAVRSLTYEQISSFIIDENYAGKSEDEVIKVPTLEEALQEASYYDLGVNLDCSKLTWTEEMIKRVIPLLYKYGVYTNTFFVMGDPVARNLLTSLYPDVNVTWLSTDADPSKNISTLKNYKNGFITYSASNITDNLISAYKAENIPVFVYDCNTMENVNRLISKGVRFVETDTIYPTEVLKR